MPGTGFGADQQGSTSTRSTRVTPTPDPTSGSGANDQNGQSDGGAAPQPGGGAAPADQENTALRPTRGSGARGAPEPRSCPGPGCGRSSGAQPGGQRCGRSLRVVRLGDRPHHDHPLGSRRQHLGEPSPSIPPIANQGRAGARSRRCGPGPGPGAGRPGLVGVGQHGAGAEVVDALLVGGGRGLGRAVRRTGR